VHCNAVAFIHCAGRKEGKKEYPTEQFLVGGDKSMCWNSLESRLFAFLRGIAMAARD